jgi:hypothetical protein
MGENAAKIAVLQEKYGLNEEQIQSAEDRDTTESSDFQDVPF